MKNILFALALLFCSIIYSQTIIPFEKKGIIFSKDYKYYSFNDIKRFTPSLAEINELEKLLHEQIRVINKNQPNQNSQPKIHKNLRKYKRQYIGYYNETGQRIVYVSFLWKGYKTYDLDGNEIEPWKTEWLDISDGGSHYWQIKFNIDKKVFFDFSVNGVA